MLLSALCLIMLCTLAASKSSPYTGIRWWDLSNGQVIDDASGNYITPHVRKSHLTNAHMSLLKKKQRRLISRNTGSAAAVTKGTRLAVQECQYQFRNKLWNCPTVKPSDGGGFIFGDLVGIGCRETSFLYAIMSAATSAAVARACGEGSIFTCSCDPRKSLRTSGGPAGDWSWGGCSDNIRFGSRFAERLADSADEAEQDLRAAVNRHNSEAGRTTVVQLAEQHCKCHGTSGSCAVQTCWMHVPSMRQVGDALKKKFEGATRVYADNTGRSHFRSKSSGKSNDKVHRAPVQFVPVDLKRSPLSVGDLVYYEDSPDFCSLSSRLGGEGVSGRECNTTSGDGGNPCDALCCGRGHRTDRRVSWERCSCTFQWCCEVTCQVCETVTDRRTCL